MANIQQIRNMKPILGILPTRRAASASLAMGPLLLLFAVVATPPSAAALDSAKTLAAKSPAATNSPQPVADKLREPESATVYRLGVGDKLNINFYQRKDLSGLRTVDGDGWLTVPLIGRVRAQGVSVPELEAKLSTAIANTVVHVTVEIIQRRPFYIIGLVNSPGAFPHVPNMTIMHAIALAGGKRTLTENNPQYSQGIETALRLATAKQRLQRALVHLARLTAVRQGKRVVRAPRALINLVGAAKAAKVVASENKLLEYDQLVRERKISSMEKVIKQAERQMNFMKSRLKHLQIKVNLQRKQLKNTESLAKKRLVPTNRVFNEMTLLAGFESDVSGVQVNIASIERDLLNVQRDYALLTGEQKLELEKQILAQQVLVEKAELEVETSKSLLSQFNLFGGGRVSRNVGLTAAYEIIRNTTSGMKHITAKALDFVQPGDLVRVYTKNAGESDVVDLGVSSPR